MRPGILADSFSYPPLSLSVNKEPKLSQAAACDGLTYQITPEGDMTAPLPGVLPI